MINITLELGLLPDEWKTANVIPIYKKDDKTQPSNYRPVSLTSCICKISERIIFKHMYNFMKDCNIITDLQSGFTPGDSTVLQLCDLYHIFSQALDEKKM